MSTQSKKKKKSPDSVAKEDLHGTLDAEAMVESVGNGALFVVERNIDTSVVVYSGKLDSKLELTGIGLHWTKSDNWAEYEAMSENAKQLLYGTEKKRMKRGMFRLLVNCMRLDDPANQRFIDVHVKKSGKMVPKVVIKGRECTLQKIYIDLVKFPPAINAMWVCGKFKDEYFEESIPIDPSIMDRIDISDFIPTLV